MTDQPRDPRDPFAPPDGTSPFAAYPPPVSPAPSFPAPTGDPLPPPAWTGVPAAPYASAAPAPKRGRAWLIAAAVVGGILLLGAIGTAAVTTLGDAFDEAAAGSGQVWISEVPTGRCYILDDADRREELAGWVTLVDCQYAHDGQIYAVVPLAFEDWPGKKAISDAADRGCTSKDVLLDEDVFDATGLSGSWYVPFEEDWDVEEHVAQCVVQSDAALGLSRSWMKDDAPAAGESA